MSRNGFGEFGRMALHLQYLQGSEVAMLNKTGNENSMVTTVQSNTGPLAASLLILAILFLAVQPAHALEKATIQLKWLHHFQFAGYYAALEKGFYSEAGLDVTILEGGPTAEVEKDVVTGRADFGTGTSALLLNRAQGQDLVVLGQVFQHSPAVFLTPRKTGIHSVVEMKGRRFMYSNQHGDMLALLKMHGIDESGILKIPHNGDPRDLIEGKADVMLAYNFNEPFVMEQSGEPYLTFSPLTSGIDFYGDNFFTTRKLLNERPQFAQAFRDASLRGWQYALNNKKEIVDLIIAKYSNGKNREWLLFEANQLESLVQPNLVELGYQSPSRWKRISETYSDLGMLPKGFDPTPIIYVPKINSDYRLLITAILISVAIISALSWLVFTFRRLNTSLKGQIEERKQAEDALRKREEIFSLFMKHSPFFTYIKQVTSTESRVLQASDNFKLMIGIDASEMIDKTMSELFPEEMATKITADDWSVVASGKVQEFEEIFNGRNLFTTKFPVVQGSNTFLAGFTIDITERKQAEDTLRENEERYRALFSRASDGICIMSTDGELVEINGSFALMHGYGVQEMQQMCLKDLDTPETLCMADERIRRLFDGETLTFEVEHYHKDGHIFPLEVSASLIASGKETYIQSFHRDISERKRSDDALRDSEARFRNLLQEVPSIAVQGYAPDGTTQYWNQASERIYGFSAQEAIGRNLVDLVIPPEMRSDVEQAIRVMAETGQPIPASELSLMRKDGSRVSVFSSHSIVQLPGLTQELFCLDIDITEQKQAEEALLAIKSRLQEQNDALRVHEQVLHEKNDALLATEEMLRVQIDEYETSQKLLRDNKKRYRAIVDSYDGQIYICSQDYQIEYLNEKVIERIGHNAVGEPCFKALHDLDAICSWCVNDRVFKGETVRWEVQSPKDNRWYYVVNTPIYNENGTISKQAMIQDITDRKQGEQDRLKLKSELHQAQKMESIGSLAGGVAHDFNNKLAVILGYTSLASAEPDPATLQNYLELIRKAGEQSADLTRQLLAFARKQTIAPKVLDLNETVSGMLKMLSRLIGENVTLTWQPAADLWLLNFDPSQIDQILANLCVNARDSIVNTGIITIETKNITIDDDYCSYHVDALPGEYVRLVVSDTGCGMDNETQTRIFEPFFTTKEVGKGTGLGLSTIFGIVKQNNGFINVNSEPGSGSTFTIYLPRHSGKDNQAPKEGMAMLAPRGLEIILLVEDDVAILDMAAMILSKQGYTVLKASSATEATRLAKENVGEIKLLITDVIMPEMNGRELTIKLQSLNPQLKCLYISGYTSDVIAQHGVLDEGVNFIQKPFSLHVLAAKVREVLDIQAVTQL
jgi:PAS domain S-box-containing protein